MVKYPVTTTKQGEEMRATIDGQEYVDVEEAMSITGYSAGHIRRLARQGTLEKVKRGTMVFISVLSLEAYMRKMKILGTEKFSPWRER
jgi:predicted transcriptional regulator of viral defense system